LIAQYLQYRRLLQEQEPPCIPLLPVIKKDLTFIHEGNKSTIDGLVNFHKMRMLSEQVREASKLAATPYVTRRAPAGTTCRSCRRWPQVAAPPSRARCSR